MSELVSGYVMPASSNASARLGFRLQSEQKSLIERAASIHGQTVTQFAISALLRAAHESIQDAGATELSPRDREVFLEMLDADGKPNAVLERAALRYRERG
jgi:uncharacterized protein (DUF1778 family)